MRIKKKEFEILNFRNYKSDNLDDEVNAIMEDKFQSLLKNLIRSINDTTNLVFNNDIYYKLLGEAIGENAIKIDFIYPAEKKVIDKYKKKCHILFEESYDIYLSKTKKYIDAIDAKHTQWIQNALYNNTEKILYQSLDSFIILKDYNTVDNKDILNCLGLPFKQIKCLRDLDESHLHLLEKLYHEGVNFFITYREKILRKYLIQA